MKNLNIDGKRLAASSPSPIGVSQEEYLDLLYGADTAVIVDALMFQDRIQVRYHGGVLPEDVGVYPTVGIHAAGITETLLDRSEVAMRFKWSHAVASIPAGQDMTALQDAIINGSLAVLSVINFGDEALQLVLPIAAKNVIEYHQLCEEVWAQLRMLGVEAGNPTWASASFLPGAAENVTLLYFNPRLAA